MFGMAVPQPDSAIGRKVVKQNHTVERMMPHSFKATWRPIIGYFPKFPLVDR